MLRMISSVRIIDGILVPRCEMGAPIWITSTPSLAKWAARRGSVRTKTVSICCRSASATAPSSRLVGIYGKRGRAPVEKSEPLIGACSCPRPCGADIGRAPRAWRFPRCVRVLAARGQRLNGRAKRRRFSRTGAVRRAARDLLARAGCSRRARRVHRPCAAGSARCARRSGPFLGGLSARFRT